MKKDLKWLKDEINTINPFTQHTWTWKRKVLDLIDQLDEPEVLSQSWIDEESDVYTLINIGGKTENIEYVRKDKLQNLNVLELELPVIPQFVANWYENHKDNLENQLQGIAYNLDRYGKMPEVNGMDKWINETESPMQTLASLRLGYRVKEEQMFHVMDGHGVYLLAKEEERNKVETVAKLVEIYGHEAVELNYQLTEEEIKGYDERFWTFRKPVKEL